MRSAFAHAISAFDSRAEKNGQSRSISRTVSSPCSSIAADSAVPSPNQAGSTIRACVHENTHGIARKSAMSRVSRRRAGREPSCSREISSTGVASWKNASSPGSP